MREKIKETNRSRLINILSQDLDFDKDLYGWTLNKIVDIIDNEKRAWLKEIAPEKMQRNNMFEKNVHWSYVVEKKAEIKAWNACINEFFRRGGV